MDFVFFSMLFSILSKSFELNQEHNLMSYFIKKNDNGKSETALIEIHSHHFT